MGASPRPGSSGLDVHNLLGPSVANAFKLFDEKDRLGVFFVFQDLSVRTEGTIDFSFTLPIIHAHIHPLLFISSIRTTRP